MENITSSAGLKNAIQTLEIEQALKGQLLKEQFILTYKGFKPANLLMGTLKDIVSGPYLIDNILGTTIGLASGYLSKKIVVGASGNIIRRFLGSILQVGVTNVIAQHPGSVKSLGQSIFKRIFHKKGPVPS
jgi:hypothetical protein